MQISLKMIRLRGYRNFDILLDKNKRKYFTKSVQAGPRITALGRQLDLWAAKL